MHKMNCGSGEDSEQPGHPSNLISVFGFYLNNLRYGTCDFVGSVVF